MLIQRLILPENGTNTELFYRGSSPRHIPAGSFTGFDTYYNCMCYTKYRDYTVVHDICARVDISGSASVELWLFDGAEELVDAAEVSDGSAELRTDISKLPEKGFLFLRIRAAGECSVLSADYHTSAVPSGISVCAAICTFRREQFVMRNTECLRRAGIGFLKKVFVIDNGGTLDSEAMSDELISVLPNRNFGGSGGFTRGLIEARRGGFTHVMLMDDDVEFYPASLEKMIVFAALLRPEHSGDWFSAAMIPLDHPDRQFEMGAEWDGYRAVVHKHDMDISQRNSLLETLDNDGVEYGGWWTLLMPVSVTDSGLPLPFFIKFDDVEYGLRKPEDTRIITMNGAAVRHEAFDKKTSFVLDHYNLRNELIVNCLYRGLTAGRALKRFWYEILKECMLYRYDCCGLVYSAVDEFLHGADFFLGCDEEELNSSLIGSAPKLSPLSSLEGWNETLRCDDTKKNKHISAACAITLGGHLIPPAFMRREISALPLSRTGTANIFLRRSVIQYQLGGDRGVMTRKSLWRFLKAIFASVGWSFRIMLGFKRAKRSYRDKFGELTSFDFWEKHLGI